MTPPDAKEAIQAMLSSNRTAAELIQHTRFQYARYTFQAARAHIRGDEAAKLSQLNQRGSVVITLRALLSGLGQTGDLNTKTANAGAHQLAGELLDSTHLLTPASAERRAVYVDNADEETSFIDFSLASHEQRTAYIFTDYTLRQFIQATGRTPELLAL